MAWSNDTTAYVTSSDRGVVLKTTNGGASWTDASRRNDGNCFVDGGSSIITDVKTLPGSDLVWFVDNNFGARHISSNGLASSAFVQGNSAVNCPGKRPQLALDTDNPNRSVVVDRCDGSLVFGFSTDGGTTYELAPDYINGEESSLSGLNDVALAGGSALAVGNGGAILISNNGRDGYSAAPTAATPPTTGWRSTSTTPPTRRSGPREPPPAQRHRHHDARRLRAGRHGQRPVTGPQECRRSSPPTSPMRPAAAASTPRASRGAPRACPPRPATRPR